MHLIEILNMKNNKKIWVIIQGPIHSPGRNFKTSMNYALNKFKDEKELIVEFDSKKTILDNIEKMIKMNLNVIYSGWKDDSSTMFINNLKKKGVKVILSDPNKAYSFKKMGDFKRISKNNVIRINNKTKQYYSFLKGLTLVSDNLSESIVIKIRSDMSLDFELLVKEILKKEKFIKNKGLILQYLRKSQIMLNKPTPYFPDFWFAGNGETLKKIFEDLYYKSISNKHYSNLAHWDIAIATINYFYPDFKVKGCYIYEKKYTSISVKKIPKRTILKFKLKYFKELFFKILIFISLIKPTILVNLLISKNLIKTGSEKLENSIIWRGDPKKNYLETKYYKKDNKNYFFNSK